MTGTPSIVKFRLAAVLVSSEATRRSECRDAPVEYSRQPSLLVPPPGGISLVVALGVVPLPDLGAVDVPEGHREGWPPCSRPAPT